MVAKRIEIDRELRNRIINEEYLPGSRLPTRVELEKEFGVSSITIQHAVNRLVEAGFAVAKGRDGTFASNRPPHLSKIALLFPNVFEESIKENQFYRAFSNEVKSVEAKLNVSFEIIDNFISLANIEIIQKLLDDILEKRLAGIIFPFMPFSLDNTPILDHPNIARVGVMSEPKYDIPAVWHDDKGFFIKAMDYLQKEQCKSPAFLLPGILMGLSEFLQQNLRARRMDTKNKWLQKLSIENHDNIGNLIELLFDPGQKELPDSLVISDDNILENVSKKLKEMGFNGKNDIKLVSLANFPWPTKSHLPVLRIGYEANKTLEICVNCIKKQLNGEQPEMMTTLPALYEDEIGGKV